MNSLAARLLVGLLLIGLSSSARASERKPSVRELEPVLSDVPDGKGWDLVGRRAVLLEDGAKDGVRLLGDGKMGFARLQGLDFGDGIVEFDVRGKDAYQKSFVGFAFHGVDDTTYDAIYFRPFNFKAEDPARRSHAVQYVSHPAHPWKELRESKPGQYEKPVSPVPEPNGWFHVRIVVAWPEVSVFVDDAGKPSLRITQLSPQKHGWLGLWTDVADGDYANLKILPSDR